MTTPGRPRREALLAKLESAVDELRSRLGGLPSPLEAEAIWTDIWIHEAHNSTAIEGNTLVLKQVESLLEEGRAVGNKQLREYLEVRGYADAARWVYAQALTEDVWRASALVTLTEVREVHRLAMRPVWDVAPHPSASDREGPGSFRRHDIRRFPAGMQPRDWTEVPAGMKDWVDAVNRTGGVRASLVDLADLHARFERIHPFLDGNGRAGRLLLNLALVRQGYPPAVIYNRERDRYLAALRRADAGDPGALAELVARAVLDNLYRFVVPALAGPSRLVPLAALATRQVSESALRMAARRGRLKAQRGADGVWRSSKTWVGEYVASRYRRR